MKDINILSPSEAMLVLAASGISTFPCNGKIPKTTHGYKDASNDPKVIQAWAKEPLISFGIPTGKSNGFIAIDIDQKSGGIESLKALEAEFGSIPKTVTVKTGGGGLHIYLKHPGFVIKNSAGDVAKGIDIRADGGYVIAPPSIHASGVKYSFASPFSPEGFSDLADVPAWLLEKLNTASLLSGKHAPIPASYWQELALNGVGEGQRNNVVTQLVGHLLAHKVDPHMALDLVLQWNKTKCYPPLTAEEVEAIFESIGKRELKKWSIL